MRPAPLVRDWGGLQDQEGHGSHVYHPRGDEPTRFEAGAAGTMADFGRNGRDCVFACKNDCSDVESVDQYYAATTLYSI